MIIGATPQAGLLAGAQSASRLSGSGLAPSQAVGGAIPAAQGIFGMLSSFAQAKALKRSARAVEMAGIAEANDRAREGRFAVGRGAAIAGASGFTLAGSASDVLAMMAAEAETSAARARWTADREAERLRFEARQTKRRGIFGAVTGVLKTGLTLGLGG